MPHSLVGTSGHGHARCGTSADMIHVKQPAKADARMSADLSGSPRVDSKSTGRKVFGVRVPGWLCVYDFSIFSQWAPVGTGDFKRSSIPSIVDHIRALAYAYEARPL